MKEYTFNLEDFRVKDENKQKIAKIFTGRDFGEHVRIQSGIDDIEKAFDIIHIIIPDNIYSINPSFLEELFVNVVKKLGKEKFMEKFKFKSVGDYDFTKPLAEAIDRILRSQTALD